jgi:hypothetical protein
MFLKQMLRSTSGLFKNRYKMTPQRIVNYGVEEIRGKEHEREVMEGSEIPVHVLKQTSKGINRAL